MIAYAIQWVTRYHRSKTLFIIATVAVVIGTLPLLLVDRAYTDDRDGCGDS